METVIIGALSGIAGVALYIKGREIVVRWQDIEQNILAHDQVIFTLAQRANVPMCGCEDPQCPDTKQAKPENGQYL